MENKKSCEKCKVQNIKLLEKKIKLYENEEFQYLYLCHKCEIDFYYFEVIALNEIRRKFTMSIHCDSCENRMRSVFFDEMQKMKQVFFNLGQDQINEIVNGYKNNKYYSYNYPEEGLGDLLGK